MALVTGPFFSTWASGSFGKVLTVRWLGLKNKFVMAQYKSRTGKRYLVQEQNAEVFGNRMRTGAIISKFSFYGTARYDVDKYCRGF